MPDDKRNRSNPNPQQDGDQNRDRQGGRPPSRNPSSTEAPDSGRARRDEDEEE